MKLMKPPCSLLIIFSNTLIAFVILYVEVYCVLHSHVGVHFFCFCFLLNKNKINLHIRIEGKITNFKVYK